MSLYSCNNVSKNSAKKYKVVKIDECEYVVFTQTKGTMSYGFAAHKGNCKYCIARQGDSIHQIKTK